MHSQHTHARTKWLRGEGHRRVACPSAAAVNRDREINDVYTISKIGYADISTPPSSCPSVGALKAADIIAYRLNDLWTFAIPENNFGTQQKWSFFLETADIKTEDANEALAAVEAFNAKEALAAVEASVANEALKA